MNFLTRIFSRPMKRRVMSNGEVLDRVATQMQAAAVELQTRGLCFIADKAYVGVTEKEARDAVLDGTTFWMPETNDCDDAAHMAKAEIIIWQRNGHFGNYPAAFGELHVDTHALNVFIDLTGTLHLIDNDAREKPLAWLATRPVRLLKF